jgi:hypothetical protein
MTLPALRVLIAQWLGHPGRRCTAASRQAKQATEIRLGCWLIARQQSNTHFAGAKRHLHSPIRALTRPRQRYHRICRPHTLHHTCAHLCTCSVYLRAPAHLRTRQRTSARAPPQNQAGRQSLWWAVTAAADGRYGRARGRRGYSESAHLEPHSVTVAASPRRTRRDGTYFAVCPDSHARLAISLDLQTVWLASAQRMAMVNPLLIHCRHVQQSRWRCLHPTDLLNIWL